MLRADVTGPNDGPVVILLHGGGQTRWSWRETAKALAAQGLRAVALDQRGHGESDWCPDGRYQLDDFAADIRAVCQHLGKPATLIGASLGGMASLLACGEAPGIDCTALVLVDISPRIDQEGAQKVGTFLRTTLEGFATLEDAAQAISTYTDRPRRASAPESLHKVLRRGADGRYRWHWDPAFLSIGDSQEEWSPELFERRLIMAAHKVTVPTLIVRGQNSDVLSDQTMSWLGQELPHFEQAVIPGVGHMIAADDNAAFNAAILPFVLNHSGK